MLPQGDRVAGLKSSINQAAIDIPSLVSAWITYKGLDPLDTDGSGGRYASMGSGAAPVSVVCAPFEENTSLPPPRLAMAGG